MQPSRAIAVGLAVAVITTAVGCRFVGGRATPPEVTAGQAPPPASRTLELEVLFVRCDEHDTPLRTELWTFVDEQSLPSDLRGRLAANGLRAGIVDGDLPPHLAARFTSVAGDPDAETAPLATDAAVTRRLLRLLPGRRSEVVTAAQLEEVVLLEQRDGEIQGGTFRQASPLVSVVARPAAGGRVAVEAVPEIRHGPIEKSWVGEDGMFRLETGQRRHRMEHLEIPATLPAGSMLVIGCGGEDASSVGDCLLRDHARGDRATTLLVAIRPLAAPIDPMFDAAEPPSDGQPDEPPLTVH